MTNLDDFLGRFPELRGVDPELLREAVRDRVEFDRLMARPTPALGEARQRELDQLRARILSRARSGAVSEPQADYSAPRARLVVSATLGGSDTKPARGSYLATGRGWVPFRFDLLERIAATAAIGGSLDFFARVLHDAGSTGGMLPADTLGVDLVDPVSLTLEPNNQCTISTRKPLTVERDAGGAMRLTGEIAFDFVFDPERAVALEGGAALACLVGEDGVDARCVRAPLHREGSVLIAPFDVRLPGLDGPPAGQPSALRYRLIPPGEAAQRVLDA